MITKSILFIVGIFLALSGCSDNDTPIQNRVTLNGESYKITAAKIFGFATTGHAHADVSFINATKDNTVKKLNIEIAYAGNADVTGSYSLPAQAGDHQIIKSFTYYLHTDHGKHVTSAGIVSGWITIEHVSGTTYKIDMELIMDDGKIFSGTYNGKFQTEFNDSQM